MINRNFEITLSDDNSFDLIVKKLNNGNPIKMLNISRTPTYFPNHFDDVDEYKTLLYE